VIVTIDTSRAPLEFGSFIVQIASLTVSITVFIHFFYVICTVVFGGACATGKGLCWEFAYALRQ
jgi:hypothetical protein